MTTPGFDRPQPGVLVVDDEKGVRELLDYALRENGFAVYLAGSGRTGVEVYERHRSEIAVVLSDVEMTDLDGPQMLGLMQQIDPTVRCCFTTGGIGKYSQEDLRNMGACGVFQKPFVLSELIGFLRQAIESNSQ